jgi:hypothetical protein
MQVAQATEYGGDVAVRQGPGDEEGLRQRGGRATQRAGQCAAESVHLMRGEMSDVGDCASLDFAVEAVGFAEEDGGRGVAIGHGGDIHAYTISHLVHKYKHIFRILHAYTNEPENCLPPSKQRDFPVYLSELRVRLCDGGAAPPEVTVNAKDVGVSVTVAGAAATAKLTPTVCVPRDVRNEIVPL